MFHDRPNVPSPPNLTRGPWLVINDDVMGGRSRSRVDLVDGVVRFHGELSLENDGGFASTRQGITAAPATATGIRMECRGDGRTYQLRLRQNQRFDGVSWTQAFCSTADWTVVTLSFADFTPVFRGTRMESAGPVVPCNIHQLGFLLADRTAGAFELEVRNITYTEPD